MATSPANQRGSKEARRAQTQDLPQMVGNGRKEQRKDDNLKDGRLGEYARSGLQLYQEEIYRIRGLAIPNLRAIREKDQRGSSKSSREGISTPSLNGYRYDS